MTIAALTVMRVKHRYMLKNTAIAPSNLGSSRLQEEDVRLSLRKVFSVYLMVQSGAL